MDSADQSVSLDLSVGRGASQSQSRDMEAEMNWLSEENKRLNEMLSTMHVNYSILRSHLFELTSSPKSEKGTDSPTKKRKSESLEWRSYDHEAARHNGQRFEGASSGDSCIRLINEDPKTKVSRVCVRTDPLDTTLAVKDGYQWRKYGQKVTRDNPSPRAYFKCSFAPSCPVKKKVQRSVEDRSILVATYEGEHNHSHPCQGEMIQNCSSQMGSLPCSVSVNPSGPMITLDLTQSGMPSQEFRDIESPEFHKLLVEQMASSLTRDRSFTNALATAISGRFFPVPSAQN